MSARTFLGLTLVAMLQACAYPGDALRRLGDDSFATPGYFFPSSTAIRVPSADPAELVYDYDRLTKNDFAHAVQAADRNCVPAGKKAHIVSLGQQTRTVGRVTFICL